MRYLTLLGCDGEVGERSLEKRWVVAEIAERRVAPDAQQTAYAPGLVTVVDDQLERRRCGTAVKPGAPGGSRG
jgi:hypothetical protein